MPPTEPTRIDPSGRAAVTAWTFDAPADAPLVAGIADFTAGGLWFGDLAEMVRGHARVVAPDLRGRAASASAPPPASIDDHVADVLALADGFGATTFALVGHGTGAIVALAAATTAPTRVERLVLLDGPPVLRGGNGVDWISGAAAVDPGVNRLRTTWAHRDAALRGDVASGRVPASGLTRSLRRALDAEIVGSGFAWRPRLSARTLEADWALLGSREPLRPEGTIPVTSFRAAHGHRDDDPPLELLDTSDDLRTVATTHSGLLVDPDALRVVGEALRDGR